jgi:hypothetical protein
MRTLIAIVGLVSLVFTSGATAQVGTTGSDGPEKFTAIAMSAGGPLTSPVAANLEIVIDRWSTAAERQRLLDSLKVGQNAALEVMRDLPRVGYIRTPGNLRWDLHYAHQMPGEDGGRRIFLGTDRPIGIDEELAQPRTLRYPFTFIEMRLDRRGDGEGKLSRATRVIASADGRFVQLENYEVQPVELTEVRHQ